MTRTVPVEVWQGGRSENADELVNNKEPDTYELEVHHKHASVPHDDHVLLAEDVEHHGTYAFRIVPEQGPVELVVQPNDSVHSPPDGFTDNPPIERRFKFYPVDDGRYTDTPFKCKIWGRIPMRVVEC